MDFSRKKRAGKIDSAAAAFHPAGRCSDRLHALGGSVRSDIAWRGATRTTRAISSRRRERPDAEDQQRIENAGLGDQRRDRRRLDAEHLAVELEQQVVHVPASALT